MTMKRNTKYLLLAAVLSVCGVGVSAQAADTEAAKFEIKANSTMREVLAERTGKRATLRMQSGEDIEGTIVLVGNGLVHVSRLAGKDFFDAVVNIDRISAVIVRVRDR